MKKRALAYSDMKKSTRYRLLADGDSALFCSNKFFSRMDAPRIHIWPWPLRHPQRSLVMHHGYVWLLAGGGGRCQGVLSSILLDKENLLNTG